jgi:hypothetical protein
MGKKLSANELQQHNDRLLEGKEDKVNSLIERLDSQKKILTPDKHSVIDWGINFLRSKALEEREKERLVAEEFVQFKTKITSTMNTYQGLNSADESEKDKIYDEGAKILREIAASAFAIQQKDLISSSVNHYKNGLYSLYQNNSHSCPQLYKEMISDLSYDIELFIDNVDSDYAEYLSEVKNSLLN